MKKKKTNYKSTNKLRHHTGYKMTSFGAQKSIPLSEKLVRSLHNTYFVIPLSFYRRPSYRLHVYQCVCTIWRKRMKQSLLLSTLKKIEYIYKQTWIIGGKQGTQVKRHTTNKRTIIIMISYEDAHSSWDVERWRKQCSI